MERLDDDRVLAVYRRAREWGVDRWRIGRLESSTPGPSLMVKGKIEPMTLYGELALDAAGRNDRDKAAYWLERGRDSEPPRKRSANQIAWEMIALQIQMVLDGPEVWVKSLAVILERYRGNQEATSAVFLRLINLGLVQVVSDPNRPDQMALDTRTLEYYLDQFGPRVTTASGRTGRGRDARRNLDAGLGPGRRRLGDLDARFRARARRGGRKIEDHRYRAMTHAPDRRHARVERLPSRDASLADRSRVESSGGRTAEVG